MSLLPTLESHPQQSSPLSFEGHGGIRAELRRTDLRLLLRREWWLWFSALSVTLLSATAFVLSAFQKLFLYRDHFYEISSAQVRWATLCLLLLFNGWLAFRQWSFRRMRRQLGSDLDSSEERPTQITSENQSGMDRTTGLYDRTAIELQLGKEIARARRKNTSLTLLTLHLDEFEQLTARAGKNASEEYAIEFARRLKEASRGSDFAARIGSDDFLLLLPQCSLQEAHFVLDRLAAVEIRLSGQKIPLTYTSGSIDYQPGDLPSDLLRRATDILHLYKSASDQAQSSPLVS
jgi:diguanylate cyclase (GGDEF)-like protein